MANISSGHRIAGARTLCQSLTSHSDMLHNDRKPQHTMGALTSLANCRMICCGNLRQSPSDQMQEKPALPCEIKCEKTTLRYRAKWSCAALGLIVRRVRVSARPASVCCACLLYTSDAADDM
eukprot:1469520-Rhodomonas_salina.1